MAFVNILYQLLFSFLVIVISSEAQNVSFILEDQEVNEVIFVGESDIVLTCNITCLSSAWIRISHNGIDVADNEGNGNNLEYNISNVLLDHRGDYHCAVRYASDLNNNADVVETLSLNIHEFGTAFTPQCIRNGTQSAPYKLGDILLLSCYCHRRQNTCSWNKAVSGMGTSLSNIDMYTQGIKKIIRVSETINSNNAKYQCSFSNLATQRCEIGPIDISGNDIVINPSMSPGLNSTLCPVSSTSAEHTDHSTVTSITQSLSSTLNVSPTSITQSLSSTLNVSPSVPISTVVITVVALASVFLLIIIIHTVLCLLNRKQKNNKTTGGNQGNCDSNIHNNNAFDDEPEVTNVSYSAGNGERNSTYATVGENKIENDNTTYDLPPIGNQDMSVTKESSHMITPDQSMTCDTSEGDFSGLYTSVNKQKHNVRKNNYKIDVSNTVDKNQQVTETVLQDGDFSGMYASINRRTKVQVNASTEDNFADMYATIDKTKKKKKGANI